MATSKAELKSLIVSAKDAGPFVSLFMKISPFEKDVTADKSQFNNLVKTAKKQFLENFPAKNWAAYQKQLASISQDRALGNDGNRGLAVYVGKDSVRSYRLSVPVNNRVVVGQTMFLLPLIEDFQFNLSYDILQLNKQSFAYYRVRNGAVSVADLPADAPTTLEKALGSDLTGGSQHGRNTGRGDGTTYNGHDPRDASENGDRRNYFKLIDKYVYEHLNKDVNLPIVLLAVSEDQGNFRKLATNPAVSKTIAYDKLPNLAAGHTELLKAVNELNQQFVDQSLVTQKQQFDAATSGKRVAQELNDVILGALSGQVITLFLTADAAYPGRLVDNTFDTTSPDSKQNNVVNDLAITVLGYDGNVFVLPKEQMPVDSPWAATLRGPLNN